MKFILLIFSVLSISIFAGSYPKPVKKVIPPSIVLKKTAVPEISFEKKGGFYLNHILKYVFEKVTGSRTSISYRRLSNIIDNWDIYKIDTLSQDTIDYITKKNRAYSFSTELLFYEDAIPYFLIVTLEYLKEINEDDVRLIPVLETSLTVVKNYLDQKK